VKVRITDKELARAVRIGLAVTGKRGQSRDPDVSVMRQFSRYDIFRTASDDEQVSHNVPAFPDDYGVERAPEEFERETKARAELRNSFDWPLKVKAGG
jgi:hypothetical protein